MAGVATFVNALAVSSNTPARNLAEYAAWARGSAKNGTIGIPAPASTPEFLVKILADHYQARSGGRSVSRQRPLLADMLGNQIPAGIASVPDFMENQKAGKLRVIGVLGAKRQASMPEVPTLLEQGIKGFEDMPYYGILRPGRAPGLVERFGSGGQCAQAA